MPGLVDEGTQVAQRHGSRVGSMHLVELHECVSVRIDRPYRPFTRIVHLRSRVEPPEVIERHAKPPRFNASCRITAASPSAKFPYVANTARNR